MRQPIFFAATRSFWLFALGALPGLIDGLLQLVNDPALSGPLAQLIASVVGVSPEVADAGIKLIMGVAALGVVQQRAGAARPYTAKLTRETIK